MPAPYRFRNDPPKPRRIFVGIPARTSTTETEHFVSSGTRRNISATVECVTIPRSVPDTNAMAYVRAYVSTVPNNPEFIRHTLKRQPVFVTRTSSTIGV